MAETPKQLIGNPGDLARDGVLADILRRIRISGSLQFCFMPSGVWQTDATPSLATMAGGMGGTMPFHLVVEGQCWVRMDGIETSLAAGDVVAFPFGTGHMLGVGDGLGDLVSPGDDLPPRPWRDMPVLDYGNGANRVRILCGYLRCDGLNFAPLRQALPNLIHARTQGVAEATWLNAVIRQIVAEVERPLAGGMPVLERLTEIIFVELLRHQLLASVGAASGWLAALADPALGRCLKLIHDDPAEAWTVTKLSAASGLSRSLLNERFETMLATSPMRYVRDWRLFLARQALITSARPIAAIGHEAGYGSEAAFNRAFARTYGSPPAAFRQAVLQDARAGT